MGGGGSASLKGVGSPPRAPGAVLPFTRSVALEYASRNIRANTILPGLMNTPMIMEPLADAYGKGDVDRMIDVRDAQCPMGHMGDAWDVAHAALFLASDDAKYITGAELVVDGGLSCRFAKSGAAPALFPHAKTGLGCRRNRESRTRPASRTPGLTGLG